MSGHKGQITGENSNIYVAFCLGFNPRFFTNMFWLVLSLLEPCDVS